MTPNEERNSAAAEGWNEAWNVDIDRMTDDYYAPDCEVLLVSSGETLHGRDELRLFEYGLARTFPQRSLRITNKVAAGDTVVVELERQGWGADGKPSVSRSCVVLTFGADGLIYSDHSYANIGPSVAALGIDPDRFGAEMIERGRSALGTG